MIASHDASDIIVNQLTQRIEQLVRAVLTSHIACDIDRVYFLLAVCFLEDSIRFAYLAFCLLD